MNSVGIDLVGSGGGGACTPCGQATAGRISIPDANPGRVRFAWRTNATATMQCDVVTSGLRPACKPSSPRLER
jgi:hypothetical protein